MKARLFAGEDRERQRGKRQLRPESQINAHEQQRAQDVDDTMEHWQERTLDIYLSPPGRYVQPGSPSAVRIRQFNGKFRMMLRDYIDEGNFIICPQAELRVSLRVLRGLMRAGFTVAGLLEIHSEVLRHKTNGLTVSIDTLPQLGARMMQIMHCDKAAVSRAAELLHCGSHSFVKEGYDSFAMSTWKLGVHRAARTDWASSGAGSALHRLLFDALAPTFAKIQRVERSCRTVLSDTAQAEAASVAAAAETAGAEQARTGTSSGGETPSAADSPVPTAVAQQLLALERELNAAKERSDRARREAEVWRLSATRWRTVVAVSVAAVAVVVALFSRRRLLPRML